MWFALIFISFLDITHLQLDLDTEYYNQRDCLEATKDNTQDLLEAIYEQLILEQQPITSRPQVRFTCQYIDLRKA